MTVDRTGKGTNVMDGQTGKGTNVMGGQTGKGMNVMGGQTGKGTNVMGGQTGKGWPIWFAHNCRYYLFILHIIDALKPRLKSIFRQI